MKGLLCTLAAGVLAASAFSAYHPAADWPVLKTYDRDHLFRIGLPIGGIGTGTVTLSGRGDWRNWFEMMNEPAQNVPEYGGRINKGPCFLVHTESAGRKLTRLLAGPLCPWEYMQGNGQPVPFHGLPRFANAEFRAAYPFGQVRLTDAEIPVRATLRAFNPFIPGDVDASSLPVAVISYEIENVSADPLAVSVCGSMHNFIGGNVRDIPQDWGFGPEPAGAKGNVNEVRESGGLKGIAFRTTGVDTNSIAWGTMALAVEASEKDVTMRTSTRYEGWNDYNTLLDFWDDFDDDGTLTQPKDWPQPDPRAAVAVRKTIPPGGTARYTFFLTWSYPNRQAWSSRVEGNHYAREYPEAWSAAERIVPRLPELEKRTAQFVRAYLSSTMPDELKEAALFNLAVLRSQTVFRLPDGHLMGWEGVFDRTGSCLGSCTHVWNFEQALPFLFPELARSMRDVEFNYATRDDGHMAFRVKLPLSEGTEWVRGNGDTCAADGQMGCIVKAYREWRFSGDGAWLKANWKRIRAAIAYAWTGKEKWDADANGVMEGKQDNTWDIPYYGPNPEVGFWYLGALKAGAEMARAVGDGEFAGKLEKMSANGRRVLDTELFNGEYYEHRICDPKTYRPLAKDAPHPPYQMGTACLCTQLAGQFVADTCGLGELSSRRNQLSALEAMMRYNFKAKWKGHFSNARSFVMEDEGGLAATAWPKGREKIPVPCWAEAWTGFEYAAAAEMIRAGMVDEAIRIVKTARARHDGLKRNPFDEPECGHFYARCLSSWGLVVAWSDFRWDGRTGVMEFTGRPGRYFWAVNNAWGVCEVEGDGRGWLETLGGKLDVRRLLVGGRNVTP